MRDSSPPRSPDSALHAVRMGQQGPLVVLVHGFTQTTVSWRPIADRLASAHRIVAVDAPGHGGSGAVRAGLAAGAALLAPLASGAVVVGYSMGARLVLQMALDHPGVASAIILVSGTAGIDDADERARRRSSDEALAATIEKEAREQGSIDGFVERWVSQPIFGPRRPATDDLAERRAQQPAGLASSLRLAGTGTMDPPLWERLASIEVPTTVMWGDQDRKFAALGTRLAAGIAESGRPVRSVAVAGAHHATHLDDPDLMAAEIIRATQSGATPTLQGT